MKVRRGYKTELDPTTEQYILFCKCAGVARYAYNYGLARRKEAYKVGQPTLYSHDLQRELTAHKHDDLPWLGEVSKWVVQNALRDLDDAYKHFFRKVKLKKEGKFKGKCRYPKFKSKHKGRGSFRLDCPVHVFDGWIQLPKIGKVKIKERGYIPTWGVKVLSATVSEKAGRWYVSVQVEEEHPEPSKATGEPLGIDLGIKTLATLSDGRSFANPKGLRKKLKALRRASRQHSRKKKGSQNRKKVQRKLARVHARIANIRKDALHKATSQIVARTKPDRERPKVIVLEDLNIQGILKNRKLSREIADVGMYEFKRQILYKSAFAGVEVKFVSRWYPSSKTCSQCGWIHEDLTLAERIFQCQQCGMVLDRDENAALNLVAMCTASSAGTDASGDRVSPETSGGWSLKEEPRVDECP
jgi:putative transposase